MILLKAYNYLTNFEFAIQALNDANISFQKESADEKFMLYVNETDKEKALNILDALDLDDTIADENSKGSITDYLEWSDNQYSPGYYLGGKIPHWMLDKKIWKVLGPLCLLSGVGQFYSILDDLKPKTDSYFPEDTGLSILFCLVYLAAGISITYRAFKNQSQ
jgi:hypothetical protein